MRPRRESAGYGRDWRCVRGRVVADGVLALLRRSRVLQVILVVVVAAMLWGLTQRAFRNVGS
jgi:hypothetical protein